MEDKVTVKQVGLKYGLILGLIFIVYGMILQFLNLLARMRFHVITPETHHIFRTWGQLTTGERLSYEESNGNA